MSVCKKCGELKYADGHSCVQNLKSALVRQRVLRIDADERAAQLEADFKIACEQRDLAKKALASSRDKVDALQNAKADLVLTLHDVRGKLSKTKGDFEEFIWSMRWIAGVLFLLAAAGWLVAVLT